MRILSRADVQRALPMHEAIPIVQSAFAQLSSGQANVPLRASIYADRHDGTTLFMPGYLTQTDALAIKIVSVYNQNPARGLPLIHAVVLALDPATGQVAALMEAGYLTALRTGAASGAATDLLARTGAEVAAIFGAGVQGRTQLQAMCSVRPITRVWVYDKSPEAVATYVNDMHALLGPAVEIRAAETPSQAVSEADVICTATTSTSPVFEGIDLKQGTHINGVGSYTPQMQEIDLVTLQRAGKIVIDSRTGALAEAGDLLIAIEQGVIHPADIYAELGEIAAGRKEGRTNEHEITFFKSVGNAAQDVAVAQAIYQAAVQQNLGTEITL